VFQVFNVSVAIPCRNIDNSIPNVVRALRDEEAAATSAPLQFWAVTK